VIGFGVGGGRKQRVLMLIQGAAILPSESRPT
jgi:hypothetical protein